MKHIAHICPHFYIGLLLAKLLGGDKTGMYSKQIDSSQFIRIAFLVLIVYIGISYSNPGNAREQDPEFESIHKDLFANPNKGEQRVFEYAESALNGGDNFALGKAALLLAEWNHLRTKLYKSAFYFQKALLIFKLLKRDDFVARTYIGIGGIFLAIEDFERAEMYQRKALTYYVEASDKL